MSARRRKLAKAAVITGSIVTAPVAVVTAALSRDLTGWQFTLTLGVGGLLIAVSVALQLLYQWLQKQDDRLNVAVSTSTDYFTIPNLNVFSSWIDNHVAAVEKGMTSVLDETIKWKTRRTTYCDAADPEGWKWTVHECPIRDMEDAELRRRAGEELIESERRMLEVLDDWRERPVLGLPSAATIVSRDTRSISEYRNEVARYVRGYRAALLSAALEVYVEQAIGALKPKVKNRGEKPVEALDVTITLPKGIAPLTKPRKHEMIPPGRVVKFGEVNYGMNIGGHNRSIALSFDGDSKSVDDGPRVDGVSAHYTDVVVTSEGEVALASLHLVTHAAAGEVFELAWAAAAKKSTPGCCEGVIRVRVNQAAVPADRMMQGVLKAFGEM